MKDFTLRDPAKTPVKNYAEDRNLPVRKAVTKEDFRKYLKRWVNRR
jgi:hypothetical protein